jgi:low affinity Fe/Cu permease
MAKSDDSAKMPSHVDERLSLFDRFATYTSERVSKAWFFGVCAVLVLIWVPTFWLWPSIDGWALVINTFASTITFLLVALLQNTETRAENATQRKLNAISDALVNLMDELGADNPDLRRSREELTAAVGVEHRESTK